MDTLLSPLISSTTRARLLLRLFSNPRASSYMRELANEFGVSTNAVRGELNRLSQAKVITSFRQGREVQYQANSKYPLFEELVSIAKKMLGIDKVVEHIINQLGDLQLALLVGDYAVGRDTGVIDLVLVGGIDQSKLVDLVGRTEAVVGRKIRTLCLTHDEYRKLAANIKQGPNLVLWHGEQQAEQ